jgi:outer membrane PBP1 activator LpoA protein
MLRPAGIVLLAFSCVLAACGGSEPEQDVEEARAKGRDTDATVFDDMIQTQDRARAVEDLTLGRKGQMDAAIEQSEGDGSE